MRPRPLGLLAGALLLVPLAACTDNDPSASSEEGGAGTISVVSTADACDLSATEAPSGNLVFSVENQGDEVTEFYLLGDDGVRIVGEVENVGPGLTRELVVKAAPGDYKTACKPGMTGDGIQADFTVTEGDEVVLGEDEQALVDTATSQYALYVENEVEALVEETKAFAASYVAGDDDDARDAYAPTRVHWERIEPVAESFGDLDPRLDLREADLEDGQTWTGWHRIEKDLWPPADGDYTPLTDGERQELADQLVADTEELAERVEDLEFTPDQLGNGAKELLDEVATGKVTGEEEIWSHTDLWDFQANVDGARVAYEDLRPILQVREEAELDEQLETRFAALQELLDGYRDGEGFVSYDELTDDQVKELADAVNALSEPLSKLTAAVVL